MKQVLLKLSGRLGPVLALLGRALERPVTERHHARISAIGVNGGPGDVADDVDRHLTETRFGDG